MTNKKGTRRQLFSIEEPEGPSPARTNRSIELGDGKDEVSSSKFQRRASASKPPSAASDGSTSLLSSYKQALLQAEERPKMDFPALPSKALSHTEPLSTSQANNQERRRPRQAENLVLSSPISQELRVIRRPSTPESSSSSSSSSSSHISYSLWSGPASPFFSASELSAAAQQQQSCVPLQGDFCHLAYCLYKGC